MRIGRRKSRRASGRNHNRDRASRNRSTADRERGSSLSKSSGRLFPNADRRNIRNAGLGQNASYLVRY